jgi:hypothetical protein
MEAQFSKHDLKQTQTKSNIQNVPETNPISNDIPYFHKLSYKEVGKGDDKQDDKKPNKDCFLLIGYVIESQT